MRRLIVEISDRDFSKLAPEDPLEDVKPMEVLHFLRSDNQEVAMILRVEFNKPNVGIEDVFGHNVIEAQLLEQEKEKENGAYIYFVKVKPSQAIRKVLGLKAIGGYVSLPYEMKNRKAKITFLGSAKQVRTSLKILEDVGVHYQVVSLTDAQFLPHSLLNHLTEKQRMALTKAHALGYYDIPKKISLVQLAEQLDLSPSTVNMQLKRAERRLLNL
jgi:predicted DNA binding protein